MTARHLAGETGKATTGDASPSPTRIGVFIDGSFWFHLHFYWLHHHPTRKRLALEGALDAMRWHAHNLLGRRLEDVVIDQIHYFQGSKTIAPGFRSLLDRLRIECHTTSFDPRKDKAIGVDVELALTCWDQAYEADLHMVALMTGGDNLRPLVERLVNDDTRVLIPQIHADFTDSRSGKKRWLVTSPHLLEAATDTPTWNDLIDATRTDGYPFACPLLPDESRKPINTRA